MKVAPGNGNASQPCLRHSSTSATFPSNKLLGYSRLSLSATKRSLVLQKLVVGIRCLPKSLNPFHNLVYDFVSFFRFDHRCLTDSRQIKAALSGSTPGSGPAASAGGFLGLAFNPQSEEASHASPIFRRDASARHVAVVGVASAGADGHHGNDCRNYFRQDGRGSLRRRD